VASDIHAMKAGELIEELVKEDKQGEVSVIALDDNEDGDLVWWHVHRDEEVPSGAVPAIRRTPGQDGGGGTR